MKSHGPELVLNPIPDQDLTPAQWIEKLNKTHAVVMSGGQCRVMNQEVDPVFGRPSVSLSRMQDFKTRYSNQTVFIDKKAVKVTKIWEESPNRRQYKGIVFSPKEEVPGYFNLWRGLAVEPKEGDWSLYKEHLFENICQGNLDYMDYLLSWMADILQDPGGERPGVTIVLRGAPGAGKGIFVTQFGKLFGAHFLHVTNQRQITGKFNAHLKDALVVFCDEAIWAGDRAAEGVLKGLITESHIMVEAKFVDPFMMKNRVRLLIASNAEWVAPVGFRDRRFCVLDVGEQRRQDTAYFGKLVDQMNAGGREAMLYDLLRHDLTGVDIWDYPQTEALAEQKIRSMTMVQSFWLECLQEGVIGDRAWPLTISTKELHQAFIDFGKDHRDNYPAVSSVLVRDLKKIMPNGFHRHRPTVDGTRKWRYAIPDLDDCIKRFEEILGYKVD